MCECVYVYAAYILIYVVQCVMDATYVYKMRFSNSGGLKFSSPNSILEGMPSTFTFI